MTGEERSYEQDAWVRLGRLLVLARVAMGKTNRAAWARELGLTHDRTLFDLENARRTNYEPTTLAWAEHTYGWSPGDVLVVLDGGEPTPTRGRPAVPLGAPGHELDVSALRQKAAWFGSEAEAVEVNRELDPELRMEMAMALRRSRVLYLRRAEQMEDQLKDLHTGTETA